MVLSSIQWSMCESWNKKNGRPISSLDVPWFEDRCKKNIKICAGLIGVVTSQELSRCQHRIQGSWYQVIARRAKTDKFHTFFLGGINIMKAKVHVDCVLLLDISLVKSNKLSLISFHYKNMSRVKFFICLHIILNAPPSGVKCCVINRLG